MSEEKNSKENTLNEIKNSENVSSKQDDVSGEKNTDNKVKKREIKLSSKKLKAIIAIVAVGAICLGGGYVSGKEAGRKLPATSKRYNSNEVVATIGDKKITGEMLRKRMEPLFYLNAKNTMSDDEIRSYESNMIETMITSDILSSEAAKEKISITDDELNAQYDNLMSSIESAMSMTKEEFLKQFDLTEKYIKDDMKKELIASKYLNEASEVTDKDAQSYYDKNKSNYLQVRASHILIKTVDDKGKQVSDSKKAELKKQAEEILKKAEAGEDFATLAKKYSEDSSAESGGDLGFFGKGQMVESFEKAAFALKKGEISSKLVESDYGYHIIEKTDEKYQPFEEVKSDLVSTLTSEKQNLLINDLKEKYNVKLTDKYQMKAKQ
ncbi:peptidylprolyl isomerase [Clostridioides difficile]|nr:peptidylprolyl isomerase [Clostridioides difficile]